MEWIVRSARHRSSVFLSHGVNGCLGVSSFVGGPTRPTPQCLTDSSVQLRCILHTSGRAGDWNTPDPTNQVLHSPDLQTTRSAKTGGGGGVAPQFFGRGTIESWQGWLEASSFGDVWRPSVPTVEAIA